MRYFRKDVMQLFEDRNSERKKRLESFVREVQDKLRKVRLKNPISIDMDLSVSLSTLHKRGSHGDYNFDWRPIRKHCKQLGIVGVNHFRILADGRVCVSISVKGERDFCAVANVVKKSELSGYDYQNNYLYILDKDILIIFWYRLE